MKKFKDMVDHEFLKKKQKIETKMARPLNQQEYDELYENTEQFLRMVLKKGK